MILIDLSLWQHTKPIRAAGARCPRRPDLGGDQATERAAQMTDKPRTQPNQKRRAPNAEPRRARKARCADGGGGTTHTRGRRGAPPGKTRAGERANAHQKRY